MIGSRKKHFNSLVTHPNLGAEPAPTINISAYTEELRGFNLTEEQASEFLTVLVPILWHFADLGFRVDISELLLSWADSDALDSDEIPNMETPSKAKSEVVTQ